MQYRGLAWSPSPLLKSTWSLAVVGRRPVRVRNSCRKSPRASRTECGQVKAILQSRYLAAAIAAPEIKSERKGHVTTLFEKYESAIYTRTHRLFMGLLCLQWFLAIVVAYAWTPLTWYGNETMVHEHMLAAIFLGGLLVAPALALIYWIPNETVTRHVV